MARVADHDDISVTLPHVASSSDELIELVDRYSAHNYHPLPVVVADAEGAWVTDVEGRRYLDMLAAYSALNFGHRHPDLIAAARDAARSRHAHEPRVPQRPARPVLPGARRALRHGDGAADEHRRRGGRDGREDRAALGLRREGRPRGPREDRHLQRQLPRPHDHDRELQLRPRGAGRVRAVHAGVRRGPLRRRRRARGARSPTPTSWASSSSRSRARPASSCRPRATCAAHASSATSTACCCIADEIQAGLGRTGRTFACEHEGVVPDVYILGKALGGGIVPVSAVVSRRDVLGVFRPGEHGSTFGGNPLACAVGLEVLRLLRTGRVPAARRRARHGADRAPARRGARERHRGPRQGPVDRHRAHTRGRARPRRLRAADGAWACSRRTRTRPRSASLPRSASARRTSTGPPNGSSPRSPSASPDGAARRTPPGDGTAPGLPRRRPGEAVVMREVWRDRVLAARPLRVVHDGDDHRSFFFVPGTAWKNDPRDHGEVRFLDGPWELEDLVRTRPVLSFAFPERAYAVLLTWSPDVGLRGLLREPAVAAAPVGARLRLRRSLPRRADPARPRPDPRGRTRTSWRRRSGASWSRRTRPGRSAAPASAPRRTSWTPSRRSIATGPRGAPTRRGSHPSLPTGGTGSADATGVALDRVAITRERRQHLLEELLQAGSALARPLDHQVADPLRRHPVERGSHLVPRLGDRQARRPQDRRRDRGRPPPRRGR